MLLVKVVFKRGGRTQHHAKINGFEFTNGVRPVTNKNEMRIEAFAFFVIEGNHNNFGDVDAKVRKRAQTF